MPVTQGVAGSSPVHTAKEESIAKAVLSFCIDAYHILITLDAIYSKYIVASHSHKGMSGIVVFDGITS